MWRWLSLAALLVAGCGRAGLVPPVGSSSPDPTDAAPTPTPAPKVFFSSMTATPTEISPGTLDIEVSATLVNTTDFELTNLYATLVFADSVGERTADFDQRETDLREGAGPPPRSLAPQSSMTFDFKVHALASAWPPGPIRINGRASFDLDGDSASATPSETPAQLTFGATNPTRVVRVTDDIDNGAGGTNLSLREALREALETPGADRIVFDPAVFPPGSPATIVLDSPLPVMDGSNGVVALDAAGAGVVIEVSGGFEESEQYALEMIGPAVVRGLTFHDVGALYPYEPSVNGNNCGGGSQLGGGAILVSGGSGAVIDSNVFDDDDVMERNCYAALVRVLGGSGHRIVRNEWTEQSMDGIYVSGGGVTEISDNVFNGNSDNDSMDEGVYLDDLADNDLWLIGNVIVQQELSGIFVDGGTDSGKIWMLNNDLGRNGIQNRNAFRRNNGESRELYFRNNLYVSNNPGALNVGMGDNVDIAWETLVSDAICNPGCGNANTDISNFLQPSEAVVSDDTGRNRSDWTPVPDSELLDSAANLLDRNGPAPGRFYGPGPDRGAIEQPAS